MLFSSGSNVSGLMQQEETALSILLNQHYRDTRGLFDRLEQEGVFLGNGSFAVAVMQDCGPVMSKQRQEELGQVLAPLCRRLLSAPVYYALTSNGTLHFILCYPRADGSAQSHDQIKSRLFHDFSAMISELEQDNPELNVIISDEEYVVAYQQINDEMTAQIEKIIAKAGAQDYD